MLSNTTIKKSLNAHNTIGLTVGALIYLICLTGTLAVLEHEIERWQQPDIAEFSELNAQAITHAANTFLSKTDSQPESLYVVLPTDDLPRAHVSDVETEWYTDQQGNPLDTPAEGWLKLLLDLHIHLHMGTTVGIIVVSSLGVMLLGLIISGLLSHPSIFKDAFRLRLGGQRRLEQVDIHNRLAVWGLPFHIMMGITGAFFGLVGIMATIAATAFFDGDESKLIEEVYGADPVIINTNTNPPTESIKVSDIENTLYYFETLPEDEAPTPIYFVFQKLGTENYFIEVAATHPGRLIYSEMYRFYPDGKFMNYQHLSDGDIGRQIAYSVYRLHFGQFGHWFIKIAYLLLGLALTIVSVSGINIWLTRTHQSERLQCAWAGLVWGFPISLTVTAILSIAISISDFKDFILTTTLVLCLSMAVNQRVKATIYLKRTLSLLLFALAIIYGMIYPEYFSSGASKWINVGIVFIAITLIIPTFHFPFPQQISTDQKPLEKP